MDNKENQTFILTIKINFMSFFESTDHPNANGTKWLGIAIIVLFIVGAILPWITGHIALYNSTAFNVSILLLGVATYFSTIKLAFKTTFETADDWKTIVEVVNAIANIIVPTIFVSSLVN
jgi:hypothetical protein